MGGETESVLKPLPAEKLCNKWGEGNPINGDGPLGNKNKEKMHYIGDDKEELVKTVQMMLKTLGYDLGTSGPDENGIDGYFGDTTEEYVIDFQRKNKDWDGEALKEEGVVGPRTADALNRAMVGEQYEKLKWYDHYPTPKELVEGKPYHTVTSDYLVKSLLIQPRNAKEGKVFLVGFIRWTATWDRPDEPIKTGERRNMILNAPGLSAGQEVIFEITQVVEGNKIIISPPIVVLSYEGGAKGEFWDWYAKERVTYQVSLHEGTQSDTFPPVKFTFVAKVAQRQVSSVPLLFSGFLDTKLIGVDGEIEEPLSDVEYMFICPWGRRIGRSNATGIIKVDCLPPGGTTIVIGGEVILSGGQ